MADLSKAYAVAIEHGGRIVSVFTCQQDARDEAELLAGQGEGDFSVFPVGYEPQWIPVSERLPDYGQRVPVMVGGVVYVTTFVPPGRFDCDDYSACHPSHWMPLPEPPEMT